MKLLAVAALVVLSHSISISEAAVYKCKVNGQTVYQQTPCAPENSGKIRINESERRQARPELLTKLCLSRELVDFMGAVFRAARAGAPVEKVFKTVWDDDDPDHIILNIANYIYTLGRADKHDVTPKRAIQLTLIKCKQGDFGIPTVDLLPPSSTSQTSTPINNRSNSSGSFECGRKSRCSQMATCAEARLYFDSCRLRKLDRNRDGTPCDKLCK